MLFSLEKCFKSNCVGGGFWAIKVMSDRRFKQDLCDEMALPLIKVIEHGNPGLSAGDSRAMRNRSSVLGCQMVNWL
jgi:hypothetical protein